MGLWHLIISTFSTKLDRELKSYDVFRLSSKQMYDFQEQFYQVMNRIRGSRVASTPSKEKDDARVTEIINGVLVSKPTKKVEQVRNKTMQTSKPEIIDLQEYARSGKAASVPGINKLRVIHNFISSNGRV